MIRRYKSLYNRVYDSDEYECVYNDNIIEFWRVVNDVRLYNAYVHFYIIYDDYLIAREENGYIRVRLSMRIDNRYKRYFMYSKIFKINVLE